MAQIIDGKNVAAKIRTELRQEAARLQKTTGTIPGLATVLVGKNPASQVYIKNKIAATQECGMLSTHYDLDENTTQDELLALIARLNTDRQVHGILVQMPLPKHLDATVVITAIAPHKDVDGFHPVNMGRLLAESGSDFSAALLPCTPLGVMALLDHYGIDPAGKDTVVIGRSSIVGKPVAMLLLARHATVTIAHSRTRDLVDKVKRADIVVAAIGRPRFVLGDWIKEGAVVIDVGINRLPDGKLCGDVDFAAASLRASYITPVPGGVGPMTIALLLTNTLHAAQGSLSGGAKSLGGIP